MMKIPSDAWTGSYAHRLGMEYGLHEPGRAVASLEVAPHHCNPNGVCHGGAIFTLADDCMGAALHPLCPEGQVPAATQVGIHYVRSARSGDRLEADTRVLSHGRRTALMESRVTDAKQRLVALITASYLFVEPR
jgi:acyl-CoA thioesterase